MEQKGLKAIILAAGKGTRMNSDLPKVLVPACGRPLVEYVIDAVRAAGIHDIVVVVGYRADLVRQQLASQPGVVFVEQTQQLGTGHAVMMCRDQLQGFAGGVMVLTGDSPLTQVSSLKHLIDLYQTQQPACILGTLICENPFGMGRIIRNAEGGFLAIVEEKDADESQRGIREVNMSTYLFHTSALLRSLDRLRNDNRQGEYYITDCPGILKADGEDVRALPVLQPCEALSINTWEDLRRVEQVMRDASCEN